MKNLNKKLFIGGLLFSLVVLTAPSLLFAVGSTVSGTLQSSSGTGSSVSGTLDGSSGASGSSGSLGGDVTGGSTIGGTVGGGSGGGGGTGGGGGNGPVTNLGGGGVGGILQPQNQPGGQVLGAATEASPGFPNAGFHSEQSSFSWSIFSLMGILVLGSLLLVASIRRRNT